MRTSEIIVRLGILILLGGYLFFKHLQRLRSRARNTKDFSHLLGKTLDTAALQPRLQQIRNDYSAGLHPPPHAANFRPNLVGCARKMLRNLPYFRDRKSEQEPQFRVG